jgi:probable rRNA maturation factor
MTAQQPAARLHVATQFAARRPWVPSAAALRRWARAAHATATSRTRRGRRGVAAPEAAVCIRIVGAAASRRLNAGYRAKDRPTNVLSFPASRVGRALDGSLGDLVICATVVAAEARAQGKALAAHWAHMVVHGVLHLHGFDHGTARGARVMEGLEVEILRGFGYQDPYRPSMLPKP